MLSNISAFFKSAAPVIKEFNSFIKKYSLKKFAVPDHICYKCSSSENFESMRKLFESESEFIYQSIISKRRIAYIKFKKPIETDLGPIWFLELSDQKPDGSQKDIFDHIEMYSPKLSYENFAMKLQKAGVKMIEVQKPHHTTYEIQLSSGFEVKITPELLLEKIKREEIK